VTLNTKHATQVLTTQTTFNFGQSAQTTCKKPVAESGEDGAYRRPLSP